MGILFLYAALSMSNICLLLQWSVCGQWERVFSPLFYMTAKERAWWKDQPQQSGKSRLSTHKYFPMVLSQPPVICGCGISWSTENLLTYLLTLSVFSSVTLSRHFEHQPDSLVHRLPKLPWVFSRFQTPFAKATLTLLTLILHVLVATNLTES